MTDQFNLPATIGLDTKALAALGEFGTSNMDALSGLSMGGYPTIRINGTRFMAVEGDTKINLPLLEMKIVFLRSAPGLRKSWYATKYDPNSADDNKAPDCFSNDGVTPHPSSLHRQSENCAGCPMNVFGTGTAADGSPGKGKACADSKQLAVFAPEARKNGAENDIFGFRVPPASLKNFGGYVKALTNRGVPLVSVVTTVGFDPNASYPVLTFKFAQALSPDHINAVIEKAKSDEVEAIINPMMATTPAAAPARTAPAPAPAPAAKPAQAAQATKPAAPKAKAKTQAAPAQAAPETLEFDMGDGGGAAADPGFDIGVTGGETTEAGDDSSDDELARALNLI